MICNFITSGRQSVNNESAVYKYCAIIDHCRSYSNIVTLVAPHVGPFTYNFPTKNGDYCQRTYIRYCRF